MIDCKEDTYSIEDSKSFECYLHSPEPSFKHTTYFHIYDTLLKKYCGQTITFVEIGVLNGGSLFMWREFFGPQARIIGIDLNPGAKKWEEFGFEIYIGSQQDPSFWDEFLSKVGKIDIVLDDGGHAYLQQIVTVESLLGSISDGGVLVVEDTHTSYMDSFGDRKMSFVNYAIQCVHKVNSRFGGFQPRQTDERIFSLQFFESIIAFHVDRKKTQLPSEKIWNRVPDESVKAKDYRHKDRQSLSIQEERIRKIVEVGFSLYG